MSNEDYRTALDAAVKEYEALGQQRREIDDRLAQLAQTIGTLTKLLGLTPTVPLGLTDACRLALRGAGLPLTPLDVRDRLLAIGVDLSVYTNELSAIHTILKRLNDAGEIRFVTKGTGRPAYIWNYQGRSGALETSGAVELEAPPPSAKRSRNDLKEEATRRKK
ncbi:MAG TPA: hypothetical protein VGY48_05130 [Vicinamibacterales bacterium]|nr:hypothetical protein [Vicinamibacterales bacterium]